MGTRGVPAQHGGFETFAERLALYLVDRGWDVSVACQAEAYPSRPPPNWKGIDLRYFAGIFPGALGSILFDLKSVLDTTRRDGLVLTLGYNTALFGVLHRLHGQQNIINMDGMEWKRSKWSLPIRGWFYINEFLAMMIGNHLVADHPEIKRRLLTRTRAEKVSMIAYGADRVTQANPALVEKYGLVPDRYALVVARAEPENSLLEIVSAFSQRARPFRLVVLGKYDPQASSYQRKVMSAASADVVFPGPIYDGEMLRALRYHARLYVHGHQVGGTNPSLVEALGAGNAVLAHDNPFNRWVAGPDMRYFTGLAACARAFDDLLEDEAWLAQARAAATARHLASFQWDSILAQYEALLERSLR